MEVSDQQVLDLNCTWLFSSLFCWCCQWSDLYEGVWHVAPSQFQQWLVGRMADPMPTSKQWQYWQETWLLTQLQDFPLVKWVWFYMPPWKGVWKCQSNSYDTPLIYFPSTTSPMGVTVVIARCSGTADEYSLISLRKQRANVNALSIPTALQISSTI